MLVDLLWVGNAAFSFLPTERGLACFAIRQSIFWKTKQKACGLRESGSYHDEDSREDGTNSVTEAPRARWGAFPAKRPGATW